MRGDYYIMAEQMGLMQRASLIIRSNVSDLLSKYEDPAKEIDIIIYDMRKELAKLKQQSVVPFGEESMAKTKLAKLEQDAADWERAATNAARGGDEADARKCFDNFQSAKAKIASQQAIVSSLSDANAMLKKQMQEIIEEISQMEAKAGKIKALSAAATATETAAKMRSGMSSGKHRDMFDRMEAKARGKLDSAVALAEVESVGSYGSNEDEDLKAKYGAGAGDADFEAFLANARK